MLACRPMLCFAVAVMAGVVAARLRPELIGYGVFGWLAFAGLAVWFVLTPRRRPLPEAPLPAGYGEHILPRPGFIARRGLNRFILIACLALFLLAMWRQDSWRARLAAERLPAERWFDAQLVALAPCREQAGEAGRWRVPARLLNAGGAEAGGVPVSLSGPEGPAFRRGDVISCRVRRRTDAVRAYPGAFDLAFWLEREGLAASLSVATPRWRTDGKPAYTVTAIDDVSPTTAVRRAIDAARARAIAVTLERGGDNGGILAAMLYGYRKDVGDDMRDAFRRVGIGHVLAISGLHVGLIVGILWWLSGWFRLSARGRALVCLVLALVYLGLSGGQVAASRATLMAVIHLAGIAWGRKSDMLNSLGAAAFFLVLANPTAPLDVSFQLSFTAVVFIYLGVSREREAARRAPADRWTHLRRRLLDNLVSLVRLSVATWVGLFPIIALVFNQVNLVGLPINIVVIPFLGVVLAGGLLIPLLWWLPGAAWLATLPSRGLSWLAHLADGVPYSSFPVNAPAFPWVALFYACVLLFLLRGTLREAVLRRRWSLATGAGIALAFVAMAFSMRAAPPPAAGRIAVLPGGGGGVLAVESPEGGMALLGAFSRGGMNDAGWLHAMRRSGPVGVVALNGATEEELAALSYHYPVAAFTAVPPSDAGLADANAWRPVDGAPGVEYCLSRDSRGRVVWLAARTGELSACIAPGLTVRQLTWRVEREMPGYDAALMAVRLRGAAPGTPVEPAPPGRVAVRGSRAEDLPAGWFARDGYGALVVSAEGVSGFDGGEWRLLE